MDTRTSDTLKQRIVKRTFELKQDHCPGVQRGPNTPVSTCSFTQSIETLCCAETYSVVRGKYSNNVLHREQIFLGVNA